MYKKLILCSAGGLLFLFFVLLLLGILEDPVRAVDFNSKRALGTLKPSQALKIIRQFAPYVYFHPEEKYLPVQPEKFISKARLRRYKIFGSDESYNKQTNTWEVNNKKTPEYYNIPLKIINSFSLARYGRPLRPKWFRSAPAYSLSLEIDEEEKFAGKRDLNGNVPVYYNLQRWERAEEGEDGLLIQYWWFMAFNEAPFLRTFSDHQGDWEHVIAYIEKQKNESYSLHSVYMSAHNWGFTYFPEDLEMKTPPKEKRARFVVYCAKGSHASYMKEGLHPFPITFMITDRTKKGYEWKTWLKLVDLSVQDWKDYAGAWGKVGYVLQGTGPLGPWIREIKTISIPQLVP